MFYIFKFYYLMSILLEIYELYNDYELFLGKKWGRFLQRKKKHFYKIFFITQNVFLSLELHCLVIFKVKFNLQQLLQEITNISFWNKASNLSMEFHNRILRQLEISLKDLKNFWKRLRSQTNSFIWKIIIEKLD